MTEEQRESINKRFEAAKKSPSAFIENLFDIRFLPYQKIFMDNVITPDMNFKTRMSCKKYSTYIYLLCTYVEMKADDTIVIASPGKVEELNKTELLEYLWKYWENK